MNIYNYLLEAQDFYYSEKIDFRFYTFTTQKFDKRKLSSVKSTFIWGIKGPSGNIILDEEYSGYSKFENSHILKVENESGYNFYDTDKNKFIFKNPISSISFITEIDGISYFNTDRGLINDKEKVLAKSKYRNIIKTQEGLLAYSNYDSSEIANLTTGSIKDLQKKGGSSYGKTLKTVIYGVYDIKSGVCYIVNHRSTYNSDREKKWYDDYQFIDASGNEYSTSLYQPGSDKVCSTTDKVYCLGSNITVFPDNKKIDSNGIYNLETINNHPFAYGTHIIDLTTKKKIYDGFIWKTFGNYFLSGNPGECGIVDLSGNVLIPSGLISGNIERIFNDDKILNKRKAVAYIFGEMI